MQDPACDWSDRGPDQRTYAEDEGGVIRSATGSGRTDRGGRCERRIEPAVQGRTTDWEATAARLEGTGMLEVEDEVEQGQQG